MGVIWFNYLYRNQVHEISLRMKGETAQNIITKALTKWK